MQIKIYGKPYEVEIHFDPLSKVFTVVMDTIHGDAEGESKKSLAEALAKAYREMEALERYG